jgi:zinc/manganese transport system substrate-binding protein
LTRSLSVRLLAGSLSAAVLLAGCGTAAGPGDDVPLVVATTSIMGDIASSVVGDEGNVEVLIPIGVDSHDFQPSAQQASLIAGADLVVANGLGLEEGLADILSSAEADGIEVIELAPLVDPIPFAGQDGSDDPHFWMDPIRVGDAAVALATDLAALRPAGTWMDRAQQYAREMKDVDGVVADLLAAVPEESRSMVTNHEAFGYFAQRYGFEVTGVVIPGGSTLAEPSSAELAALVDEMRRDGARVIFAETTQPTALADAVAAELGEEVEVVELFTESLGPEGSGAETLADLLETNAGRIAESLG